MIRTTTELEPETIRQLDSRRRARLEIAFVILLVAGTFLVLLWGMSKLHFWDENVYLQDADVLCCGKTNYSEIASRPPLLSILFAGAFLLWHSDYAAWILTALLNATGPALLYLAGRRLVGKIAAGIAALLLAFTPYFAGILPDGAGGLVRDIGGHSLLADCPAVSLILLSLWLLLRALEKQTDLRFASAGLALALAMLMRFGSLSSVAVLCVLLLAAHRRVRAVLACSAGFAVGIGPYLCWSRLRYGGFLATIREGWSNFGGAAQPFFFYLHDFIVIFSWLTVAGLAIWFVRTAWQAWRRSAAATGPKLLGHGQRHWEAFLVLWAFVILLFFSALSHKEQRYILPVAPPLFLLAGVGLGWLVEGHRRAARIGGAGVLVALLIAGFWPVRQRFNSGFIDPTVSEEMTVSDFLKHAVPLSTVLYANQNYPDFAYYSGLNVSVLPEDGDSLYQSLDHLPADGIVIAYKPDADNPDAEPALGWLDANPRYRRLREFPSLVVYEYHVTLP
jgi:4-amino-4-deoxy-L-arabinose transferase-like glycosyltransferase